MIEQIEKRYYDEYKWFGPGLLMAPAASAIGAGQATVRTFDRGCLAIQAPAVVEGIRFRLDGCRTHSAGLLLENWIPAECATDPVETYQEGPGDARRLLEPDVILFRGCTFESECPWTEGPAGLISLMRTNTLNPPHGYRPWPFRVVFEHCTATSNLITLFDGHVNFDGLNVQVDVRIADSSFVSTLHHGGYEEPFDPHAVVLKSSRGVVDIVNSELRLTRPDLGRDVAANLVVCSDGVLKARLEGLADDDVEYDVTPTWLNAVQMVDVRGSLTPKRWHGRNSAVATTGPFFMQGTLTDVVNSFNRCEAAVNLTEELGGRQPVWMNGTGGWMYGTGAQDPVATRWLKWHP